MVAGLTTLKKAKRLNVWEKFEGLTDSFKTDFNSWSKNEGLHTRVHTYSSLFWFTDHEGPIRNIESIPKSHGEKFRHFFKSLIDQKIYLAPNGFEVGFLGNAHNKEIMEESLEKFKKAALYAHENFKG